MSKNNTFTINLNSLNEKISRESADPVEIHADLIVKGFADFNSSLSGDTDDGARVQIDLTPLIEFVEEISGQSASASTIIISENIAYIDISTGGR